MFHVEHTDRLLDSQNAELADLERQGLRRALRPLSGTALELELAGQPVVNFCSNDYLGLGGEIGSVSGLDQGAGASRLISGNHPAHRALEEAVADWLGCEAVLLFGSGYQANLGLVSALVGPGDLVLSDALNHASLIDGCRLSKARIEIFPHGDVDAVARLLTALRRDHRRCLVLTESLFSMDGDRGRLEELHRLAEQHSAGLIVDEAHAFGALGDAGRGLGPHGAFARVGTFGKALGTYGAFVAGPRALIELLTTRARSFVFSTALPPVAVASAQRALERAIGPEGDARRVRLAENVATVDSHLARLGLQRSGSHIVPLRVRSGEAADAMRIAQLLLDRGLFVQGIRPPTVPSGTARLRLSLSAAHRPDHLDRLLAAITALRTELL